MRVTGWFVTLAICLLAAAECARGQVISQNLSFNIVGQYQIDFYASNADFEITNLDSRIRGVQITSSNIVKAIAVDLEGQSWTNWRGAALVRETDMATGNQAIFLRAGLMETNVSSFFGDSFSNDFRADLPGVLGFTNTMYLSNGVPTELTNTAYRSEISSVPTAQTNLIRSSSLFAVNLNTSNLKLNFLAFGTTIGTDWKVAYQGANYSQWVDSIAAAGVGNFAINLGTNLFFNTNLYETTNFVSGPARGNFMCHGAAFFGRLPGF